MTATASGAKTNLSFAISYGLAGGPAHARRLKKLLRQAGYRQKPLIQADIIIAHSAGCWLIPADVMPQLIIYVGMPLNQTDLRQTWRRATLHSFRLGVRQNIWIKLKSSYYGLRQPRRTLDIVRRAGIAQPRILPRVPAVFLANRHDFWIQAGQLQKYVATHPWAFIGLPGGHDDIWQHPARYVSIINHYAKLLD